MLIVIEIHDAKRKEKFLFRGEIKRNLKYEEIF